ncbi:MAG: B12-binding domain-containing radical SAM protein [Deltaproteobacteria bacterium]|nr:B12-binding domain-containing radical SAM protein [Deltaproteobacteria bacterium]
MKILLIQPPIQDFYDTDIRLQPLGLCMLKAAAKKFMPNMQVTVRDYHQGHGRKTIPLPAELSYLRQYFKYPDSSPFSTFFHYYHFGASFEEIAKDVTYEKPDLVGISSLFSPYHREALACAREIKKRLNIPILMGGSHVSAAPLSVLNDWSVDFIIRGEGERPFVEFLKAWKAGLPLESEPNLGFKRNGEPVLNPMAENFALGDLPVADFSDLSPDRYLFEKKPLCFITTSRGCPHQCTFCSVHLTFGDKFRRRSPENVLSEIRQRYSEGYRVFDFEDDNLSFSKEDLKTILNALIAEFPEDDLRLVAMNGISYLSLDRELLELMKKAGFRSLNISLVSANADVLTRLKRPHTLKKYLDVVNQAHSLGFDIVSYQILGIPYETPDDMVDTMALMASLPVLIGASIFYLTPGCPIAGEFPEMTESDIFKSRSTAMAIETDQFRRDDLYTLFITARIINFLKGLRLTGEKVSLQDALKQAESAGHREKLGAQLLRKLLDERRLYAATKGGFEALPGFKADIFLEVWTKYRSVRTLDGTWIDL